MTEATFHELLARRKESGLTIHDFCSNEGIAESTYYYWKNKLNKKVAHPKEFIPLLIGTQFPAHRKNQLSHQNPSNSENHQQEDALLEFIFPNGTRLLVRNQVDLSVLQAIVHLCD